MSYLINEAKEAQEKKLALQREAMDRQAVASGNVDKNSALYRHAKLNGWDLGGKDELHGPARANAAARDAAQTRMAEAQADAMEAGIPRRSAISAFAADGEGNFSFYGDDPNARLRAGFDGIMANANAQKADRARRGRATLGSMVGHAMDNGGMVPRELGEAYGHELGQNGPAYGTLTKDGTFISLGVGQGGNVQPTGLVKPLDVLKAMVQSGDWKNAKRYNKGYIDGRYTEDQVKNATGYSGQWANDAQTKEERAQILKLVTGIAQGVLKGKSSDPGMEIRRKMLMDKDIRAYIARGKPVMAEDGKTQMRDDNDALMYKEATQEEMKANLDHLVDLVLNNGQGGGGQSEMDSKLQFVNGLLDRLYPRREASPEAAAIQQRALSRANVIDAADGKQQLIRYVDEKGQHVSNGYIVDGKAYDRGGDEMRGVTPLGPDWKTPVQGASGGVSAASGASAATQPGASDGDGGQAVEYDPAKADSYQPGDWFVKKGPDGLYKIYKVRLHDDGSMHASPNKPDNDSLKKAGYDPLLIASDGTIGPTIEAARENFGEVVEKPSRGAALAGDAK